MSTIRRRYSQKSTFRQRYTDLEASQKVPKGIPAYMLYVNRRAGRMIAAASPEWVTPNMLTLVGAFISYAALLSVWILPIHGELFIVGIVLLIAFAIDSADGQLSRLRGGGTPFGGWLDHVIDAGRFAFLHITVAAYMYRTGLTLGKLAWCAVFLVAAVLIFIGGMLTEHALAKRGDVGGQVGNGVMLRSFLLLPVDYGILCALFLFLPLTNVFIAGYSVLAALNALFCVMYLVKWSRELQRVLLDSNKNE